jgi:heme exporter protein A
LSHLSPNPSATATSTATHAAGTGLLEAHDLACRRGRRLLFTQLNLQLSAGSVTWLRGTNGSGKTSLLRLLAGLSTAADGSVLWNGQPLADAGSAARQSIVYIGHANALKDDLTLHEALSFLARLAGLDAAPARATSALARLGLAAQSALAVRQLSQGQRRRGALARLALDEAPRTWLLDEPYDALDDHSTQLLSTLITQHAARGGAVLLTSHQPVSLPGLRLHDMPATAQAAAARA